MKSLLLFPFRRLKTFLILGLLVPSGIAASIFFVFYLWGDELPSPQTLRELEPSMNTTILDRHGHVVEEFYLENRSPLSLQEIPVLMQQAVLSTEDTRFRDHWGLDLQGVVRAMGTNLARGRIEQGASTITQQLARKLFLTDAVNFERKFKEAALAIRLERSFSKDEILELYLNKIYFGGGAYGVEAAAQSFFGRRLTELALEEMALLAGVLANPSAFNPARHPENARRRRNLVLRRMLRAGVIDSTEHANAEASEIVLTPAGKSKSHAPYFSEMVRQELAERYGDSDVYTGGLMVYTTIDMELQRTADEALEEQIATIEKMQAHRYKYLDEPNQAMGTLTEPGQRTKYLQGALIALEPQSGAIRAMVGGRNFAESKFNRATQGLRQPGSAFKPIVFAVPLMDGHKTNDILLDTPFVKEIPGPGNKIQEWAPQNFDLEFRGPVTLRYAMMKSLNIPSIRLLEEATPRRVVDLAHSMGIERNLPPYLSLALGTGEVTPLELTSAYSVFANRGIHLEPYMIERVEDRHGQVIDSHVPDSQEVLDEKTSALMVSILRSVMDGGTGISARTSYGYHAPAAGKTGTTDDYSDAWFVGFSPKLACGVWIGFDQNRKIGRRMTGGQVALPAWAKFMRKATEVYGDSDFEIPANMFEIKTCRETGLIAVPDCPAVNDLFEKGRGPTRTCPIHEPFLPGVDGDSFYRDARSHGLRGFRDSKRDEDQ